MAVFGLGRRGNYAKCDALRTIIVQTRADTDDRRTAAVAGGQIDVSPFSSASFVYKMYYVRKSITVHWVINHPTHVLPNPRAQSVSLQ